MGRTRPGGRLTALADRLGALLGTGRAERRVAESVVARYREPHRAYHGERHLAEVLAALDALTGAAAPVPVLLAAYWHDAVYDPRATDSEERSARLAQADLAPLGLDAGEVVRLVRLTAAHDPAPEDRAGGLLCDADLAVLAAPPQRYAEYAACVREEYAHVADEAFRAGRAAVLRTFLDRPAVYATAAGRERWEVAARRNVAVEIAALTGDGGADRRR
ncbi:MAG: metal-dependent phosphohydrolase [Actinomycetota bacterium]|nr:metal-dependent phosphohydrolase [Actinomycetota bacterium]